VSERRACRVAGIGASSYRYGSRRTARDAPVRRRLLTLAEQPPRWGSPRLHWLLVLEGFVVNHERTERLYREGKLPFRTARVE
jgi:putative transposase